MSEQHRHRGEAPCGEGMWQRIDTVVTEAAGRDVPGAANETRELFHVLCHEQNSGPQCRFRSV